MSSISPILTIIENDLKAHAEKSLFSALDGVLTTVADGTKGLIAYHCAIVQAQQIVNSAIHWLATNPDVSELPTTFMPEKFKKETPTGSTPAPVNETVVVSSDGTPPVVTQQ
jgi:hypothetical protein